MGSQRVGHDWATELNWCAQLCMTLCSPMDYIAHHAPLPMAVSRQENWNGMPFPTPGNLPNPGIEPISLAISCISRQILYLPPGKPHFSIPYICFNIWYCFSFSDLLRSVQALSSSISLEVTQISSFSWLSNIPLSTCTTTSLSTHLSKDM